MSGVEVPETNDREVLTLFSSADNQPARLPLALTFFQYS